MLWVEPAAACNLSCESCPTAAGRSGGIMNLADFRLVLDKIPRSVRLLNMWHRGEPLVAPEFPEMVRAAARRGIKTQTHSNGILLAKRDIAPRLVSSGLTRISIGVDGPDQQTYRNYRQGGNLADVEAGIRLLAESKKKSGANLPRIYVECLLGRQTHGQLREIETSAKEWGADRIRFKTLRVPDVSDTGQALALLPDDRSLWRYRLVGDRISVRKMHRFCLRTAFSAVITWDGNVLPCCFDADASFILGNIFDQDWKDIWTGDDFRRFRRAVNHDADGKPSMCFNCTEGLRRLYRALPR